MRFKLAFLPLVAFLLLSCVARYNQHVAQTMASWKGHRIDEVIASWGPPANVYETGGVKSFVWRRVTGQSQSGHVWATEYRIFAVDAKGIILDSKMDERRE